MNISRRIAIATLASTLSMVAVGPAFAAGSVVNVSLWDKGETSMYQLGEVTPMGMAMEGADMTMATMGISINQAAVPAGEVTFDVSNDSKDMIHEMVLAPITNSETLLPYLNDLEKVDEDAAGHLGEVAELDTGASGSLTMTLDPGTYILYCNIPGHYVMGMWTLLTVEG